MGLFSLSDKRAPLIIDTSVVINLNACGAGIKILSALQRRIIVVEAVTGELDDGATAGRDDAARLKEWIAAGVIIEEMMDGAAEGIFEQLVSGPAGETLDDGEAATVAHAIGQGAAAVIDERKANRICAERFPQLPIASTVDLMLHPLVVDAVGAEAIGDAVFQALIGARMRVLSRNMEQVLGLLGSEKAALCRSLPGTKRRVD